MPPLPPSDEGLQLPLCDTCRTEKTQTALLSLRQKLKKAEKKAHDTGEVCRSCANVAWDEEVKCDSRDCPVFYSRVKARTQLNVAKNGLERVLNCLQQEASKHASLD